MTFEGMQLQGAAKIMEKLNVSIYSSFVKLSRIFLKIKCFFRVYRFKK